MGSESDTDPEVESSETEEGAALVEEPLNTATSEEQEPTVEKSNNEKDRRVLIITLIVALCVSGLVIGLFVGLTTSRRKKPAGTSQNGDVEVSSNGTTSADGEEELDGPTRVVQSDNAIGSIHNGLFRTATNQPLQAELPVFGHSSLIHYSTCLDLRTDIYNAASIIANEAILAHGNKAETYYPGYYDVVATTNIMPGAMPENKQVTYEDSYETNNQVEGVDEADVIKSTADHVFAAYGDQLIVWDAITGVKLSVTKVSNEEDIDSKDGKEPSDKKFRPTAGNLRGPQSKMMFPGSSSKFRIANLLLHGGRLTAILSKVDFYHPQTSIIHDNGQTTLMHYDISNIPSDGSELPVLATKELQGGFKDARMVGGVAHIITMAPVDSYYHLTRHLNRYQERYQFLNDTEYVDAAASYAADKLLPSFADRLMDELSVNFDCQDIIRMSAFQTVSDENVNITIPRIGALMDGVVQISTFNMEVDPREATLRTSSTVDFIPNSYGTTVYANGATLVLAVRGYRHTSIQNGSWRQHTYIKAYSLDDENSGVLGHSVGIVSGYLINQYAMDIYDGHIRVASTMDSKWGCVYEEKEGVPVCTWEMINDSDNHITVLELPEDSRITSMKHVGFLKDLGEVGERIEAVRFMKDKGFLVTFLRTDPFYTFDLSNHTDPKVIAELKVSGFSNYLHPYDEEGNMLIAVGQDADEKGVTTGLQISLFDVTDLENPTLLNRFNVENDPNVWSSSEAQYDPKAFRFLPESKKLILPVSVRQPRDPKAAFDGFIVFDVSPQSILMSFKISHLDPEEIKDICWSDAYMSARSVVHRGIVTTMKGHTVLAHNLNTKEKSWELNFDEDNENCNGYWPASIFFRQ